MRHDHRWMMSPGKPAGIPVMLYKLDHADPLFRHTKWWMAGNDAEPFPLWDTETQEGAGSFPAITRDAQLNPLNDTLLWAWRGNKVGVSAKDRIYLGKQDDPGYPYPIQIAENPSGPTIEESWSGTIAFWTDFGQRIVYRGENNRTQRYAEIREVNPDGSNNVLIYSRTSGPIPTLYSYSLDYGVFPNRDYTLYGWNEEWGGEFSGGPPRLNVGIWVYNRASASASRIVAALNGVDVGLPFPWSEDLVETLHFFAWANNSDRMLISSDYVTEQDPPYTWKVQTVNADGTGRFTLFTYRHGPSGSEVDPYSFAMNHYNVWLPDDSGIVGVLSGVYTTEPKYVLAILKTDGSGVVPIVPERRITQYAQTEQMPVVFDDRIYFPAYGPLSVMQSLASVALDGSDYKIDHEFGTAENFRGFHGS